MPSVYQVNNEKLVYLLGLLAKAAPALVAVGSLMIISVLVLGQKRINNALLDMPAGQTALGCGFILQVVALAGVWGTALLRK